jgi:predicted amidohydrolase YtcJ
MASAKTLGIVELHDPGVGSWDYVDALAKLREVDTLPIRMRLFLRSGIADATRMTRFGDSSLELCGVKFYVDGWIRSRTCALCDPFSDEPENSGVLFHTADELARRMAPFAEQGWQLMAHAIGDRAIEQTLDAYERIYGESCREAQPRIEHAQVLNSDLIARLAELGVQACIQPSFAVTDEVSARPALGERYPAAYDWQGLLDAGVNVVCGSDYPLETQDPLLGLQRLVTASSLDLERALGIMTNDNCGSVTLSEDPRTTPPAQIHKLAVIATEPVFDRPVLSSAL